MLGLDAGLELEARLKNALSVRAEANEGKEKKTISRDTQKIWFFAFHPIPYRGKTISCYNFFSALTFLQHSHSPASSCPESRKMCARAFHLRLLLLLVFGER
jgi:hypothetical protein